VYTRSSVEGKLIVGLYVDDFICVGPNTAISKFKSEMHSRFKIKELGPAHLVIGLQIKQSTTDSISQETYVCDIVHSSDMANAHPSSTPLTGGEVNATITNENHTPVDTTKYRHIVGKTMYAMVGSRPNIAFTVGTLGKFTSNPTQ
jgi:Reverse transcriptase (RNA-dependent DNA polymerase)